MPHPTRDRYADLNLRGDVPTATLTYTPEEGVTAKLELRGVGMNLPLEPTSEFCHVCQLTSDQLMAALADPLMPEEEKW